MKLTKIKNKLLITLNSNQILHKKDSMLIILTTTLLIASPTPNMDHHSPPPHNLLNISTNLENQQFLNFPTDIDQQLRYLIIISDPVVLVINNFISQHS